MAVYNLPEKPGFGARFGTGLGQGLAENLGGLADRKLQARVQRGQQQRTQQGLDMLSSGDQRQFAQGISLLPQNMQVEAVKALRMQAQEANLEQALSSLRGGQPQPSIQPEQQAGGGGLFGAPQLGKRERIEVEKLRTESLKEERKQERDKWQFHQKFLDDKYKKLNVSKKNITRFQTLKKLTESDNLSHPTYYSLLKKIGLDIPTLLNPGKKGSAESELYLKTTQDFVKDIKDIFGARITEKQIIEFLKTIPTLENTDEGKKLIIDVMMFKENALQAEGALIDDVVNESGGAPPYNLRAILQKRSSSIYDDLAKEIIGRIDQSRQITASQQSLNIGKFVSTKSNQAEGTTGEINGKPVIYKNGKWVRK